MSFQIKNHIAKGNDAEATARWFDLSEDTGVDGFEVKLAHISRRQIGNWTTQCTKMVRNPATKKKEPKLDNDALFSLYTKHVLIDWKGLDVGGLKRMIRLKDVMDVPESTEVEYSRDNAKMVLTNALEVDTIITELAIDPSNYNDDVDVEESEDPDSPGEEGEEAKFPS